MNPITFLVLLSGLLFVSLIFTLDSRDHWRERAQQFRNALERYDR